MGLALIMQGLKDMNIPRLSRFKPVALRICVEILSEAINGALVILAFVILVGARGFADALEF